MERLIDSHNSAAFCTLLVFLLNEMCCKSRSYFIVVHKNRIISFYRSILCCFVLHIKKRPHNEKKVPLDPLKLLHYSLIQQGFIFVLFVYSSVKHQFSGCKYFLQLFSQTQLMHMHLISSRPPVQPDFQQT